MTYFILNRQDITEEMWVKAEPMLASARGRCCGQFTVLAFEEENIPSGLTGGMTLEQFIEATQNDSGWVFP